MLINFILIAGIAKAALTVPANQAEQITHILFLLILLSFAGLSIIVGKKK